MRSGLDLWRRGRGSRGRAARSAIGAAEHLIDVGELVELIKRDHLADHRGAVHGRGRILVLQLLYEETEKRAANRVGTAVGVF